LIKRQKKALQHEHTNLVITAEALGNRVKYQDSLLEKKEADITDLVTRVNDTVKMYEQKIEQKEEQIWILSEKLRESKSIEWLSFQILTCYSRA